MNRVMACYMSQEAREQLLQQLLVILNSDQEQDELLRSFNEPFPGGNLWRLVTLRSDSDSSFQPLLLWKACFRHVCGVIPGITSNDGFGTLQTLSDSLKANLRVYVVDSWLVTLPLCLYILQRQKSLGRRVLVGVGGVAAAGKTTWCQVMKAFLSFLMSDFVRSLWVDSGWAGGSAVLGMDAFHLTNERLAQLGLRSLKGQPGTFDAAAFTACVQQVKEARCNLTVPVYNRALHNPVADAMTIVEDTSVVLIEGLFVLLDSYGFHVHSMLDISVFLHVDEAVCCQRAVVRKAHTNSISKEDALAHYKRVDGPNYAIIAACKDKADFCLCLSSNPDKFCVDKVIVKDSAVLL